MSVAAVIPARLESSRFPRKVLAAETGRPLIQYAYEVASAASCVDHVFIATDAPEIVDVATSFGANALLTSPDHPNGTSRIAEVASKVDAEIIVNLQADEPELPPAAIDAAVKAIEADPEVPVATLASPLTDLAMASDPAVVKVVCDQRGRALYFSRSLIPYDRDGGMLTAPMQHVGLYVYRQEILPRYLCLSPTPLEQTEKLEQLRLLEHGVPMAVATYPVEHQGIDTPEQYAEFVKRCAHLPKA